MARHQSFADTFPQPRPLVPGPEPIKGEGDGGVLNDVDVDCETPDPAVRAAAIKPA